MTKEELKIIVKKIQNECALEEPTKITYYWDEHDKIVFKLFFESLCVPKNLRIEDEKVSNLFTQQNVYEYEDDFKIISLNQDEGFIEIIPDDQNFKVVNSYKDVKESDKEENEAEKKEKEESLLVRLAGKRLNEKVARQKGYMLFQEKTLSEEGAEKGAEKGKNSTTFFYATYSNVFHPSFKDAFSQLQSAAATIKGNEKDPKNETVNNIKVFIEPYTKKFDEGGFGNFARAQEKFLFEFLGKLNYPDGTVEFLSSDRCKSLAKTADSEKSKAAAFTENAEYLAQIQGLLAPNLESGDLKGFINAFKNQEKASEKSLNDAEESATQIYKKYLEVLKNAKKGTSAEKAFKSSIKDWDNAIKLYKEEIKKNYTMFLLGFVDMCYSKSSEVTPEDLKILEKSKKEESQKKKSGSLKDAKTRSEQEFEKAEKELEQLATSTGKSAEGQKNGGGFGQQDQTGKGAGVSFDNGKGFDKEKDSSSSNSKEKGIEAPSLYQLHVLCFSEEMKTSFSNMKSKLGEGSEPSKEVPTKKSDETSNEETSSENSSGSEEEFGDEEG